MASTGSRREAIQAGIIPETKPIPAEIPKPRKTFFSDKEMRTYLMQKELAHYPRILYRLIL